MPPAVQTTKSISPKPKIRRGFQVKKVSACMVAPTESPRKMVHDVHERVLGRLGEPFHDAGLAHEISEHEHPHQGGHSRNEQADEGCGDQREK